jgi:hydroxylaminobenzene mutase
MVRFFDFQFFSFSALRLPVNISPTAPRTHGTHENHRNGQGNEHRHHRLASPASPNGSTPRWRRGRSRCCTKPSPEKFQPENNMTISTGGKQILLHGLALILAGLVFGFAPPLTPYPRLALGAHIQFVTNGMLLAVLAMVVLKVPHRAGPKSVRVMVVSTWLTWFMALSEAANAWWGANQMLPIAAKQAGAAGAAAWQEAVVKLCHLPAALGLILSVTLLIIGIVKHRGAAEPEAAP